MFFDVLCVPGVPLVFVCSRLAVFRSLTGIPRPGEAKEGWTGKACSAAAQLAAQLAVLQEILRTEIQGLKLIACSNSGNQATCLVPSSCLALFLALFGADLIG